MKTERNCFILYHDFAKQFALLTMEQRGELITAIFEYARTRQLSGALSAVVNMAFSFIKDALDRDHASYLAKCEQNSENGKKGGRPKKQSRLSESERFSEETKKADMDRDMDMDKGMEQDKEMDLDMDTELEWDMDRDMEKERFSPPAPPVPYPRSAELCEEEREELIAKGIPTDYISERAARAASYGNTHGKGAFQVLLDWWHDDRARAPWNLSQSRQVHRPGTGSAERGERKRQEEYGQPRDTEPALDWGEWRNKTPEEMLDDDFGRAALRWYDKLDAAEAAG